MKHIYNMTKKYTVNKLFINTKISLVHTKKILLGPGFSSLYSPDNYKLWNILLVLYLWNSLYACYCKIKVYHFCDLGLVILKL